jgi:hypothetical protein
MSRAEIGQVYYHYKNNVSYKVIAIANDADSPHKEFVIYQSFATYKTWARYRPDFESTVEIDGITVDRFTATKKPDLSTDWRTQ